jgi:hypothetical protein
LTDGEPDEEEHEHSEIPARLLTNKIIMINTQRFRVKRERRAKPALDCLGRLRRRDKAFCKSLKKG